MAKILLNNPENTNPPDKVVVNEPVRQVINTEKVSENTTAPAADFKKPEDDFAVFPDWDLVPPNSIINPRIKKKP